MGKPFYSIGMIFKNEIRCLERCLRSLQPLRNAVPCEIVMADTGSTDGSREVAERYADVLFDFEWVDDFSAARNAVMDRCSGQWYFSIDADEWLPEDIKELVMFSKVGSIVQDFAAINIRNYKTPQLEKVDQYVDFKAVRIGRLKPETRYVGRIHEKWVAPSGANLQAVMLDNTWLHHDGYAYFTEEEAHAKQDRNMGLLKKKLEEDPENIQTYIECMDSSKRGDASCVDYARGALKVLNSNPDKWNRYGPVVYRGVVSIAQIHKLSELEEWVSQAVDRFPKSIFTRIDVAYYAAIYYWDNDQYAECIPWCEMCRQGLADYRAGNFDHNEMLQGVVEWVAPYWERKLIISLTECYLNCKEYRKAYDLLTEMAGSQMDEEQVRFFTLMLLRLHRIAEYDTPALMTVFWENLTKELPEDADESAKKQAKQDLDAFTKEAYGVFTPKYRKEEQAKEDFIRHSYTVFLPLEGRDTLGDAAAILETTDPQTLQDKLLLVEKLNDLPIHAIAHAMTQGVEFPLPGRPLSVEEMDDLVKRLAQDKESFFPLALKTMEGNFTRTLQSLCWARGLALSALRENDWTAGKIPAGKVITLSMEKPAESTEDIEARSMAIARGFARVEGAYLPVCYTPELLNQEALFMLPPLHRFGWYCSRAFQALDRGNQVGYVRLLREGLGSCENAKDVAEFLMEHIPEVRAQEPSAEMAALAEQIRAMLARFAPDDPAVTVLKQSEAYQKVVQLIEGVEPPVAGGLLQ